MPTSDMHELDCESTEAIDRPPVREISPATVWAVSLAFWIVLLIAGGLYGSVALAPRLSAWIDIRHSYITNAHQLKSLETEVDYLERVRNALKTDPEFVQRLASTSISENSHHSEVIPVSGLLVFGGEEQLQQRLPEIRQPAGAEMVRMLASDRPLRTGLLASAGVLVVFAFTVLNGNGGWFVATTARVAIATVWIPLARYRRLPDAESEGSGAAEDGIAADVDSDGT